DNGESERRLRDVAMGRRNYLFAGSDTGAERAAIVYSILGGCALNGVEPWAYLNDVVQRIVDGWPMSRLAELLPANYAATLEAESRSTSGAATAR
ncbi:MAG TPA: transposase domain-containing protein, partial [Sandaracinaceae bacterium LLY-WYZ-13_1]|nr:transposase domain-containing protein [Sandaracinaceae bacterium LLY-WYZ-13_1]